MKLSYICVDTRLSQISSKLVEIIEQPIIAILKYKVEWRLPGQDWTAKVYDAVACESFISPDWSTIDSCFVPPLGRHKQIGKKILALDHRFTN